MSVRRHTEGKWIIRFSAGTDPHTGRRIQPSKVIEAPWSTEGRRHAEHELARFRLDWHATKPAATETVAGLLNDWFELRSPEWSPRHADDTRRQIDQKITPRIGSMRVADITGRTLAKLYADLAATGSQRGGPLKAASVRRVHVALHAAFAHAVRWGELAANPAEHCDPPGHSPKKQRAPTPEQVRAALAAETHPMWSTYLALATTTGARRSQLLGLCWSDIDLDAATIEFSRGVTHTTGAVHVGETKSGNRWSVAVGARTVAVLRVLRAHQAEGALAAGVGRVADPFVFASSDSGEFPLHPQAVNRWWDRGMRRKVPSLVGVSPHDLRHFAASFLIASGVDVQTVAHRLGHANASVTLAVYSHLMPAADRAAADILDAVGA